MTRSGWPFVGRARELAHLERLVAAGTGALLVGEPGVGKSALAREVVRRAAAAGVSVGHISGHAVSNAEPFEAFGGLLAGRHSGHDTDAPLTVPEVARQVGNALAGGVGTPLLYVDDVHLLDESSARVLLWMTGVLADGGSDHPGVIVVATAPSTAPLPTLIGRLGRAGACERIDLAPLAEADVERVLQDALDGEVEPRTVREFLARSEGNPLFLRELVTAAVDAGALAESSGPMPAWRLVGDPPVTSGVRELVTARLGDLPEELRAGLELVAAGEPLALPVVSELLGAEVLDALDERRLLTLRDGFAGAMVATAHPIHGDVLRAELPPMRVRRLRLSIARRLETQAEPVPHDLVRAAAWRLDSGEPGDPNRLLSAARAARGINLATAERLARHVQVSTGSLEATLLLAEICAITGRGDEAVALTAALPPESLRAEDREAIAYATALGQLSNGDGTAALGTADRALSGELAESQQLRALYAAMLSIGSRYDAALAIAPRILDDAGAAPLTRSLAALAATTAAFWSGQYRDAIAYADRAAALAEATRDAAPVHAPSIEFMAISALAERGDLDAAEQRALRLRRASVQLGDPFGGPRAEYGLGRIALLRGRPATAMRQFSRALSWLSPFDEPMRRSIEALQGRAAAACGDLAAARSGVEGSPSEPDDARERLEAYAAEDDLARAAVLAAALRLDEAAELACWSAEIAASRGQRGLVMQGYHDAARYGRAPQVGGAARDAASDADGELAACYRDHIVALASDSGPALDEVARRFEAKGLLALAAETRTEAALAHTAAGQPRRSQASRVTAAALWRRCGSVPPPWLAGAALPVPLTARERQAALLAAAGDPDAVIASRLRISIRTVQTHLAHVYAKLGIAGRGELSERLAQAG